MELKKDWSEEEEKKFRKGVEENSMKKFWENFTDIMINEGLPAVCLFLLFGGVWIGLMCFFAFLLNLAVGG